MKQIIALFSACFLLATAIIPYVEYGSPPGQFTNTVRSQARLSDSSVMNCAAVSGYIALYRSICFRISNQKYVAFVSMKSLITFDLPLIYLLKNYDASKT